MVKQPILLKLKQKVVLSELIPHHYAVSAIWQFLFAFKPGMTDLPTLSS